MHETLEAQADQDCGRITVEAESSHAVIDFSPEGPKERDYIKATRAMKTLEYEIPLSIRLRSKISGFLDLLSLAVAQSTPQSVSSRNEPAKPSSSGASLSLKAQSPNYWVDESFADRGVKTNSFGARM